MIKNTDIKGAVISKYKRSIGFIDPDNNHMEFSNIEKNILLEVDPSKATKPNLFSENSRPRFNAAILLR